jgi:hypothetical protein
LQVLRGEMVVASSQADEYEVSLSSRYRSGAGRAGSVCPNTTFLT